MVSVSIKRGNAVTPYRVVERQTFHTEFAAQLFGYLFCQVVFEHSVWEGGETYWALECR